MIIIVTFDCLDRTRLTFAQIGIHPFTPTTRKLQRNWEVRKNLEKKKKEKEEKIQERNLKITMQKNQKETQKETKKKSNWDRS